MMQRNVLADLNAVSARLSKTQSKIASNREISKPSDDPFDAVAGAGAAPVAGRHPPARSATRRTRRAGRRRRSRRSAQITDLAHRARELLVRAPPTPPTPPTATRSPPSSSRSSSPSSRTPTRPTAGSYLFSGTQTATPPYQQGAVDAYGGDLAGYDPAQPGILREIGPGVSLSINSVATEFLGEGQAAGDGKLLDILRSAVVAPARRRQRRTARHRPRAPRRRTSTRLLDVRARNGASANRIESALSRLSEVEETTLRQLSETEDADIAKTIIDFNSQQAAYQAALRAGASIVQTLAAGLPALILPSVPSPYQRTRSQRCPP